MKHLIFNVNYKAKERIDIFKDFIYRAIFIVFFMILGFISI